MVYLSGHSHQFRRKYDYTMNLCVSPPDRQHRVTAELSVVFSLALVRYGLQYLGGIQAVSGIVQYPTVLARLFSILREVSVC